MSVPPVRSMPAKGVPTPLGRGLFSALGLTQRTRRETQRVRVPWRPLRQSLCGLCVEMPDATARPRVVTFGVCPRFEFYTLYTSTRPFKKGFAMRFLGSVPVPFTRRRGGTVSPSAQAVCFLTQRARRETQRARVPWRPLRQSLCGLCIENAGREMGCLRFLQTRGVAA